MASLRELFAGVRNTFAPQAPSQADLIKLVQDNKLDDLREAFDKHDLKPDNLLLSVRSPEMVDFLVGKGADVNHEYGTPNDPESYPPDAPTPLLQAVRFANLETVQRLIHHGADPGNGGTFSSFLLGEATMRQDDQQEAVVRALLDGGANPNNPHVSSILSYAAQHKATIGSIHALLEHGANPSGSDNDDMTALHFAAQQGRGDLADLLLDYGADHQSANIVECTPLHLAALSVDMDMVSKLISRGADPAGLNSLISEGNTVLTFAATNGDFDSTQRLLENGANPRLAMQGSHWIEEEKRQRSHPTGALAGRKETMDLVRNFEANALRQTFAEVEQEQAQEVAEAPAPRRRVRL